MTCWDLVSETKSDLSLNGGGGSEFLNLDYLSKVKLLDQRRSSAGAIVRWPTVKIVTRCGNKNVKYDQG